MLFAFVVEDLPHIACVRADRFSLQVLFISIEIIDNEDDSSGFNVHELLILERNLHLSGSSTRRYFHT